MSGKEYKSPTRTDDTVRWRAYPSWGHFIWLHFFSLMAGIRGLLLLRLGMSGWAAWLGGAMVLLVCVALVRRWAHYSLTSRSVVITNGYTGRAIQTLAIDSISEVTMSQGPIARFFDVGTLEIRSGEDCILSLRGIKNPEVVKTRLEALRHMPNLSLRRDEMRAGTV